jgi:hypothetical protein
MPLLYIRIDEFVKLELTSGRDVWACRKFTTRPWRSVGIYACPGALS